MKKVMALVTVTLIVASLMLMSLTGRLLFEKRMAATHANRTMVQVVRESDDVYRCVPKT